MTWSALFGKFVEFKDKATPRRREVPPGGPAVDADFAAIYRRAGIAPAAYSGEQAFDILSELPADLAEENKRRMFKKTIVGLAAKCGASQEDVLQDVVRKTDALSKSIEGLVQRAAHDDATRDAEIKALEGQIREKVKASEKARTQDRQLAEKYRAEIERLDKVAKLLGPNAG